MSADAPDPWDGAPYRLDEPDAVLPLPRELDEISGLTVLPSGRLGAVQDEEGTIYEVDPATGQIVSQLTFRDRGDFEGIALTDDAVWALRSDGVLFRVSRADNGHVLTEAFETPLSIRNDAEGLAFDAARNRLLIALKEDPGPGLDGMRAVHAFSLDTRTLSRRPVILLDRSVLDGPSTFKPSGIAVHPRSGRVYVLSSVRKALAVVAPNGTTEAVFPFPDGLVPQPEGIAFAPDGTLFISSEGSPGLLLRYAPATP